eukprot:TRINITY_DN1093_c0_g1_i1.p3 TRINITY_DN1093_c0_g1~~TRINITY_DN1093_c0_g1_i1.p3  ORF type:complete len:303 (-),score=27.15 TRINITY_DN1093_c0_g1_i1:2710-3618(-)
MEQQNSPHKKSPDRRQLELTKRLNKELAPFTLEDLPLTLSDDTLFSDTYLFQKILGAGTFGVVVAAIEKSHLEQCAIKIISKNLTEESDLSKLNHEAELLSKLDHPNIVKFHKVHESPYHYFIVMERLKGGSLWDLVCSRRRKKSAFTEEECRVVIKQIFEGLSYMHSMNFLHRDLKPANILLKSFRCLENSVKLADFGLSTKLESEPCFNPTERCGTRSYMAPELIQGKRYSFVRLLSYLQRQAVDIWAVGIVMYVLLTGKHPFCKSNEGTNKFLIEMRDPVWSKTLACSQYCFTFITQKQ